MPYEPYDKSNLTSSSHLTVSQNIELRNLLNECNRLRRGGNLAGWRWAQDALRAELEFDLERLDKELKPEDKYFKKLMLIEIDISKHLTPTPAEKESLYHLLDKREKILRHLQEKSGKGTKRTFSDEDYDDEE